MRTNQNNSRHPTGRPDHAAVSFAATDLRGGDEGGNCCFVSGIPGLPKEPTSSGKISMPSSLSTSQNISKRVLDEAGRGLSRPGQGQTCSLTRASAVSAVNGWN